MEVSSGPNIPLRMSSALNPASRTTSLILPVRYCVFAASANSTGWRLVLRNVTSSTATGNEESRELPGVNGLHVVMLAARN